MAQGNGFASRITFVAGIGAGPLLASVALFMASAEVGGSDCTCSNVVAGELGAFA